MNKSTTWKSFLTGCMGGVILYFVFDLCLTIVQPGIAFLDGLFVRFVFILIVGGIMMFFYLTKKRRTS